MGTPNASDKRTVTTLRNYALAIAFTIVTALLRWWMGHFIERPAVILYAVPILLSAYLGGFGSGIVATVLSLLITAFFFMPPYFELFVYSSIDQFQLLMLFITGVLISIVSESLHRSIRRSEEAKQKSIESEELYRSLFDNMLNGFAFCRMIFEQNRPQDFIYLSINDAFSKLTGLKDVIGKRVTEIIPGIRQSDPKLFDIYGRVALSGIPEKCEIYVEALQQWFSISVYSPRKDHFVTVFDVITERKRAEEAVAASEKKFKDLLETIQLVAVMLDSDGNITFCNDYLLNLTGWSRDEVLGKNWFDIFIPEEGRALICDVFKKVIAKDTVMSHYEDVIMTREGKQRLIVWDNTALSSSEGNIIGTASIGVDITEHRKLEEHLRQSQKLEAIGELAGGVAHDFNNILSAIVGYAHLTLMKLPGDDLLRGNLQEILRASDRAVTLTQGLLAFSRKQVMNPKPVDLNDIVRAHEKLLARLIREDIDLSTSFAEHKLMIFADSVQIEQILMNLVTNARDAMSKGGHIIIRTQRTSLDGEFIMAHGYGEEGYYALLSVSDTGEGMDAETKERIFEPFFTTKELGKGTGLGLAMVYGIVKQHSGYITVDSESAMGTTFSIYLPLIKNVTAEERKTPEAVTAQGGTETILIAEDDAALRKLFSTILRHHGYQVIESVDGEDAVKRFTDNKGRVCLVIMDGIMPKKNGKEAYQEILAMTPAIKTIFLSGYAEDIISKEGLLDPGINFILKPVSPVALLNKVREVLDEDHLRAGI